VAEATGSLTEAPVPTGSEIPAATMKPLPPHAIVLFGATGDLL